MRITNVEKFREDLYEAIKDTCEWKVETPAATWKNGFEYKETMSEYNRAEMVDGKPQIISLANPMRIESLYMTVDPEGVTFWESSEKYFKYSGSCSFEYYRNKLSFIAALVLRIAGKLEK